jgi:acyl-CoA thioester hydrolase
MRAQGPAHPKDGDHNAASSPQSLDVRVYYEDTDFSGVVYHASYLRFFERGRTELLRGLGVEHTRIFAGGPAEGSHFVVRMMTIDFIRPALMDDLLRIETRIASVGGASIEMGQRILRGADVLVAAKVKIALVSGGKPRRIPAELSASLLATASDPRGRAGSS